MSLSSPSLVTVVGVDKHPVPLVLFLSDFSPRGPPTLKEFRWVSFTPTSSLVSYPSLIPSLLSDVVPSPDSSSVFSYSHPPTRLVVELWVTDPLSPSLFHMDVSPPSS